MYCSIYAAMLLAVMATASAAETYVVSKQKPSGKDYGWLFQFLDRNKNSVVDADDIKRMPPPMRNWLLKSGIDSRHAISRKRFLQFAPQMMESVRNGKLAPVSFQPSTFIVEDYIDLSVRLPAKHRRRDKNKDGQIGFYEWGTRDAAMFSKLDRNDDGFLTPLELGVSPSKFSRKTKKIARSPRKVFLDGARSAYQKADRNRDGLLSTKEWARLPLAEQSLKASMPAPRFPMAFQQFHDYYLQAGLKVGR